MSRTCSPMLALAGLLALLSPGVAAHPAPAPLQQGETESYSAETLLLRPEIATAPVVIDGKELFRVRGVSAFPAPERAAQIEQRILDLASDKDFDVSRLVTEELDVGTRIRADDGRLLMGVLDADGQMEDVSRHELAVSLQRRIASTISEYREERKPDVLWRDVGHAGIALGALALALFVLFLLARRADRRITARYAQHGEGLEIHSFQIVRAERISMVLRNIVRSLRWIGALLLTFIFLRYALSQFPWTRGISVHLGSWVISPLKTMGLSVLHELPDLVFLAMLFVVVRWILRLFLMFFRAVEEGHVRLEGFERDWAVPTYRLVRIGVVAMALVVAYPYIPGSESGAFKGVSLFLGVLVSLGSSSAISNTVAGYLLTYRRAFLHGDRVKIGDVTGDVTRIRLQVTHVRTPKNEEVTIPNSIILSSPVVNYSTLAREAGLILHISVGIGYETPWRQVEAMLLLAADRAPGLRKAPKPFVLQRGLGDFAVTYELNGYCESAQQMLAVLSEMSRQIQDVFNEHGVQIMTPNYVADTAEPKIVPPARWHLAPAAADAADAAVGGRRRA